MLVPPPVPIVLPVIDTLPPTALIALLHPRVTPVPLELMVTLPPPLDSLNELNALPEPVVRGPELVINKLPPTALKVLFVPISVLPKSAYT